MSSGPARPLSTPPAGAAVPARSGPDAVWRDVRAVDVIAPNFKRRLSGVTATLERVVPVQARTVRIAALAPVLAPAVPRIRFRDVVRCWRPPAGRAARVWHARRNIEMLAGVILRDLLRMPFKLVFTSASQRRHTAWTRFLIRRMDAIIATSDRTASYLLRPATVVRHGIDTDQFRPPADKAAARRQVGLTDRRWVGCFGRIRQQKGTDVFVDAMIRLLPARPDAGAVLLGRATAPHAGFLAELRQRVRAAGLQERIVFAGEVAPSETPAWYRALDVFVAPQRWEGFGVTPLEAMASGVPVVATTVGAFPELVVPEVTGTLIPPGDVGAMAREIARLLDDPPRAARLGAQAIEHVARAFSLEAEAGAINAVYRTLLGADPSR